MINAWIVEDTRNKPGSFRYITVARAITPGAYVLTAADNAREVTTIMLGAKQLAELVEVLALALQGKAPGGAV